MEKGKTFDLVKSILESVPETRDDDFELIYEVAKEFGWGGCAFGQALTLWRDRGCPSFESITRARRKVQELHPELRSEERVAEMRAEQEGQYREFYGR